VPYSAGTIILQVVPSYLGFQDKNKEMADGLAKALEEGLDKGAESGAKKASAKIDKILGEETSKGADKAGSDAAEKYAGAFRTKLKSTIATMQREIKPIKLDVDNEHLAEDLAKAQALLKELSKRNTVKVGADTTEVREKVAEAAAIIARLTKDSTVEIKGDAAPAIAAAKSFEKYVDGLNPTVEIKVDTAQAERQLGSFEKKLKDRLSKAMSAIGTSGSRELQELQARLQSLNLKKIGIDVSGKDAEQEIQKIERDLAHLVATTTEVQIHGDASDALAALESVERAREKLDGKRARVKVDVDGAAKATTQLSLVDRMLAKIGVDGKDAANSFRFFNFAALAIASIGAALIPIIATLSVGIGGLAVAAIAGVAGLGILAVAFSGLGGAIKALNDQQDNAAKDAEAAAKRQKAAARQVADAERSLSRAVEDSAQRNQDASKRVADARQSAADSIESAIRQQEDAERRFAQTQKSAADAQRDLTQARVDAQKELDDIALQQRRNALDERQGVIDLFNATVADTAARKDPGATNLDKEQASIQLAEAKLRLEEIRKQSKELKDQAKGGVDNSQKVKTAQEKVTEALQAQKDALRDLGDADKAVTRARVDGADQIKDALEAQRRAGVDGQQAIADATLNLRQAQEDYNDSLKDTSTSAQKVAEEMGKLGPAGQAFALFIHGLRDDFTEIRDIIQEAFLPKLTEAIQILMDGVGPDFKTFIGDMATLFGDLAVQAAKVFTNPTWDAFWKTIADIAPVLTKDFGKAFLDWLTIFAVIAVGLAPIALEMAEAFADWSDSVLNWTKSKAGQKSMTDFLGYVRDIAPDVKDFFKALVGAVKNLAVGLAPFGDTLLAGITGFLTFVANMDPQVLGAIVLTVLELVGAFQLLSGALVLVQVASGPLGLIALAVAAVVGALIYFYNTNADVKKIVDEVWPVIQFILVSALQTISGWISLAVTYTIAFYNALKYVWEKGIKPFFSDFASSISDFWTKYAQPILSALGKLFTDMGSDIKAAWDDVIFPVLDVFGQIFTSLYDVFVKPAIDDIGTAFGKMGDGFKWVYDNGIKPIFNAIAHALGLDDKGAKDGGGLVGAFESAIGFIQSIWDGLIDLAKSPVKFVVETVINKGIIAGFNKLGTVLPGLKHIEDIVLPFANGTSRVPDATYGVRPGYTPGRDNQIIAVGGGEAILRPELSRALGSNWIDAANKRAKNFGVQGALNFLGGFKNGTSGVGLGGGKRTNNAFGDWDRTTYHGKAMDFYTVRILQAAERLAGHAFTVTQGSYSNSVAASFGTHSGGGVLDLAWIGKVADVVALRMSGFAAWHRDRSQGPWNDHIHAVAIGDPTASPEAKKQVTSYFNGGDGLGGKDDGPDVGKDRSLLGKLVGGIGSIAGWVSDAISHPIDYLKGKITGKFEELTKTWGDNSLTQLLKSIPESIMQTMSNMISGVTDFITGGPSDEKGIKGMVQKLAENAFGWTGGQWDALSKLVQKESSWNPNAKNPSSSAFGLFQFLDGTWGAYGEKTSDPRLQAQYGMQYIKDRYGTPENALNFHNEHNWYSDGGVVPDNGTMMYDQGGYLPPGVTQVVNLTGKPEPVFTHDQFDRMNAQGGNGSWHYEPHFEGSDLTADDVMDDFAFELRRFGRGS
jgi:hypothetical protein